MTRTITLIALCGFAASASAQAPVIDGTRDAAYGAPIVVQQANTQFGNVTDTSAQNGSELNAAYARVDGGRLFLMMTGNQEPNFNKLDVFIDSVAGGENTLSATPGYDFANSSQNLNGLTFDSGFEADFHLFSRWGGGSVPMSGYEVDFVNRNGGGDANVAWSSGVGSPPFDTITSAGSIIAGSVGSAMGGANAASGTALTQNLGFAINNSNIAGVSGDNGVPADQAAAAAVTTGMEFSIALADLGLPANFVGEIKIAAMINNGDHNYLSNQILGALPAMTGNLGGDGGGGFIGDLSGVDFNQFAGNQYFTVFIPAPASAALLGLGAIAGVRRRR